MYCRLQPKKGLFCLLGLFYFLFPVFSQAPNQPSNPSPANSSTVGTVNPLVCATVSDPNGGNVRVRFFGRPKPANASGKFRVIILPDTQYYTEQPQGTHDGGNVSMFTSQTNWIVSNRVSTNIVYVGHLGDCVQNGDNPPGANNETEWQRVNSAISVIESPVLTGLPQGIPFGLCVGNHDQTPNGSPTGTTTYFNQYYGSAHFAGRTYYGGHNGSNNDNHYQLFSADGTDFLVISFEYDQTAGFAAVGGALDWAEGLVQTHSKRKVIVMTHYMINENTTFSTQGQAIYNRLRNYPNVILLLGGHVHSTDGEARRIDAFNGHTIHSVLSDYQDRPGGGNGLLRIYEFEPKARKVSVKTFSPFLNTSETDADSEFELAVNTFPLLGEVNVASGSNACFNWTNLASTTDYEWYTELYDGQNVTTGPVWTFSTPSGGALPATMTNLLAKAESGKVKLAWTTLSESNNHHFEIERSRDGIIFEKINTVASKGNSATAQDYTWNDEQPLPGKAYYQLKQVDIDGRYKYSDVVSVRFINGRKLIIYPNPASGSGFTIFFNDRVKGNVKVLVYDMAGKECHSQQLSNVQNEINIAARLSSGIYTIRIIGEDFNFSQKLVVKASF